MPTVRQLKTCFEKSNQVHSPTIFFFFFSFDDIFQQKDPTEHHLGLPQNFGELADMFLEGSLLPAPGKGQGPPSRSTPNSFAGMPSSPLQTSKALETMQKSKFFIDALSIEPQQRWNNIHWSCGPDDALSKAQALNKPIFVEMFG
jgi:hypothetical protein